MIVREVDVEDWRPVECPVDHGAHDVNRGQGQRQGQQFVQPDTILYCPPRGALAKAAAGIKLTTCAEGFIDRRYAEDGNLCPRTEKRALIEDVDEAVSQALKIAIQQTVTTLKGTTIPLEARTLCIHGDSPDAVDLLRSTRSSLEEAGIRIMAP